MRRFATFFKGFAKGFFKIAKVIRKIPNEFRTSNRNASRSLAVTPPDCFLSLSIDRSIEFVSPSQNKIQYQLCTNKHSLQKLEKMKNFTFFAGLNRVIKVRNKR